MSLAVPRFGRGVTKILFAMPIVALALTLAPALPALALDSHTYAKKIIVNSGREVDSVYTPTGDIEVLGSVRNDVKTGYGDIVLNGPVGGDVDCGFGNVMVNAPVRGDIHAAMGDVYVNSRVNGGIEVGRGDVYLRPKARVGSVTASGTIHEHPDAVIDTKKVGTMSTLGFPSEDQAEALGFAGWILATLAFVAAGVLFAVISPNMLSAAASSAGRSPGRSLLVGVVSIPAFAILAVVLALSVVGIPLLLLLAPAYLALVLFGAVTVAYFVGSRILFVTGRYRGGNALAATVGALLVAATALIPVVGNVLLFVLALLGTGAAFIALFARRRARFGYEEHGHRD